MICPSCGIENQETAKECLKCQFKFQFGHGYNDPKSGTFPNFLKSGNKKTKAVRIGVFSILIVALALVVFSWFKSM
jgi:hypothetical protein